MRALTVMAGGWTGRSIGNGDQRRGLRLFVGFDIAIGLRGAKRRS